MDFTSGVVGEQGGFASEGTCHRMRITALCKVSLQGSRGLEVTERLIMGTIEFADPVKEITGRARGDGGRFSSILQGEELYSSSIGILGDVFETTRATLRVGVGCSPAITIDLK